MATEIERWGTPSAWTQAGRDVSRINNELQVAGRKSVARAELREFEAQLRRRYTENRMHDARDVMNLALDLAGGNKLIVSGLMEFAGEWMRNEQRVYRQQNSEY